MKNKNGKDEQKKRDNLSNQPITSLLLHWYESEGRELPWRETKLPYNIWISEIILQQTRVAQGKDYYLRFIERFPNVQSLAEAEEQEVLKLWQGLGYYTRARNLHAAAKQITTHFQGIFPSSYSDIISLKGVGEYTSAAIASIAFGLPYAVLDGNVLRVISRLFGITQSIHLPETKRIIKEIAQSLLPTNDAGKFNQAIMDFGAMICTPASPRCDECTLRDYCTAFAEKKVRELPVNERRISIRSRYFHYFHIQHRNSTYLQKRGGSDIWKNLFEFPLIETESETNWVDLSSMKSFSTLFNGVSTISVEHSMTIKHQLTHQSIFTQFYRIAIPDELSFTPPDGIFIIENEQLYNYPVSRLIHKYLENF